MSGLDSVQAWLGDRLTTVARDHKVPGAAVAVFAGHEVIDAATGVLSTSTGVDALPQPRRARHPQDGLTARARAEGDLGRPVEWRSSHGVPPWPGRRPAITVGA